MKLVAYARDFDELALLGKGNAREVLLGHRDLSRVGALDRAALAGLARAAKVAGIRPILEWDILHCRDGFERAVASLRELDLGMFDAIRVQDPGAYEYVLTQLPGHSIQLVLETGNHNFEAVRRWCEHGKTRLERVVLSSELPARRVAEYIENLSCDVELLVLGPILLLYTPRRLLSYQRGAAAPRATERALASGEEDFHAGFRVLENQHGTLLFHSKDYCLLDRIEELEQMGLAAARIDLRLEADGRWLPAAAEVFEGRSNGAAEAFKAAYPNKVTRCFFQANATDVLLKRLKNSEIERRDEGYIGKVVESNKGGNYLVVWILGKGQSLRVGQKVKFITPNGANVVHEIEVITDLERRPIEEVFQGEYGILPHLKLLTPETVVYRVAD